MLISCPRRRPPLEKPAAPQKSNLPAICSGPLKLTAYSLKAHRELAERTPLFSGGSPCGKPPRHFFRPPMGHLRHPLPDAPPGIWEESGVREKANIAFSFGAATFSGSPCPVVGIPNTRPPRAPPAGPRPGPYPPLAPAAPVITAPSAAQNTGNSNAGLQDCNLTTRKSSDFQRFSHPVRTFWLIRNLA